MRLVHLEPRLFWAVLIGIALAGVVLLAVVTPEGMGLTNDSVAYINGARGLMEGSGYGRVSGNGVIKPITHFPPLFSMLLAGVSLLGMDAIAAAQVVNLLLFGGNIMLAGLLARRLARSSLAGLLAAALMAASETLLRVHTFALSEPLFVFLTLGSLLAFLHAFSARVVQPLVWIAISGLLAGLSYLTRYVGGALIAALLLAILLFHSTWRNRLRDAGMFLLCNLPLVGAWSLRNTLLTGSATNRQLSWHPVAVGELAEGLKNFWAFLLPSRFDLYERLHPLLWQGLLVVLLLFLAGWVLWVLFYRSLAVKRAAQRERGSSSPYHAVFVVALHLLAYLAYVFFSMTLVDASTIFEDRILSPVYVDLLLLAAVGFAWLMQRRKAAWRWLALGVALALLLSFVDDTRAAVPRLRQDGQGFASTRWTNSQTMDAVRRLPRVTIYTNRLSALTLLADRPAYALLGPVDPVTQQLRPDYDEAMQSIRESVKNGKTVLVVFAARALLAGEDGEWLGPLVADLPLLAEYDDGIIYGLPAK